MTDYVIRGDWPKYDVYVNDGYDGYEINRASDMTALMRWFAYQIRPGDTITWEATAIPGTPK